MDSNFTALRSVPRAAPAPLRLTYTCTISPDELAELGEPLAWEDLKTCMLSKGIPPSRLGEGSVFDFKNMDNGDLEILFP